MTHFKFKSWCLLSLKKSLLNSLSLVLQRNGIFVLKISEICYTQDLFACVCG